MNATGSIFCMSEGHKMEASFFILTTAEENYNYLTTNIPTSKHTAQIKRCYEMNANFMVTANICL